MKKFLLFPIRQMGILALIMVICAGLLYYQLGYGLLDDGGFVWDEPIILALYSLRQSWLDSLFNFITHSGDILIVAPVLRCLFSCGGALKRSRPFYMLPP